MELHNDGLLSCEALSGLVRLPIAPGRAAELPRRVVFLNGPPGCGKDTLGHLLAGTLLPGVRLRKLAEPLKNATHALYGVRAVHGAFEATKGEPNAVFFGLTPRQAYIDVSERLVKPALGVDFFGRVLARAILADHAPLTIITDSGFEPEARPIIDAVGAENCLLFRIHRTGHTFAGDSRSYIELDDVETVNLANNGNLAEFVQAAHRYLREWQAGLGS